MRSEDEDDEEEYDDDQEDEDGVNGVADQGDDDDDDGDADGDGDGDVGMDGGGSDDEDDEDDDGDGDEDDEDEDGDGDDDDEEEDDEDGDEDDDDGEGDGDEEDEDVEMADGDADGDEEGKSFPIHPLERELRTGSPHSSRSKAASQRDLPPPPHLIRRSLLVPSWTTPPSSLSIDVLVGIPLPAPVHALASTMCSSYLLAGSQEGYIRVYDFYASVNGGQMMTAQQKTMVGLGESVTKAGVGKGWWPVEVDSGGSKRMEPVYSLACESDGLWVLSGTQSGPIQLHTLRHSPGHLVHSLKGHTSVVSCMALLPGERNFVSGSWDGTVREWDLNTGQAVRAYPTHGAQIAALAPKPFAHPTTPSPSPSRQNIEIDGEASNGPAISVNVGSDFFAADRANGDAAHSSSNAEANEGNGDSAATPAANGEAAGEDEANGKSEADGEGEADADAEGDAEGDADADADGEREASYDPLFDGDADGEADAEGEDVPISEAVSAIATPSAANAIPNGTARTGGGLALPGNNTAGPSRTAAPPRIGAASSIPLLSPTTYSSFSDEILLTASMDGQVTLMDRRMGQGNVGRLVNAEKTPPWCMSACWSGDGRQVFAGRRNGTIDIWDVRRSVASSSSTPAPRLLKTLKTPTESGPVSCVVAFPDGRHIATASQDNIRLWNTLEYFEPEDSMKKRNSRPPFKIIAGHHGGTISSMLVDPTSRFLTTASGDRGWQGESTRVVLIHEVKW